MTTATPQQPVSRRRPRSAPPVRSRQGRARAEGSWKIRTLEIDGEPARELIARPGAAGSVLVIDREALKKIGPGLVDPGKPLGNATLICTLYADAEPEQRRCRRVSKCDASAIPLPELAPPVERDRACVQVADVSFAIARLPSRMSIPELPRTLSLRDAVAAAEDYEPLCSITRAALARHAEDPSVSTTTLRAELARVLESPIILNRGLRQAVLAQVARNGTSLSEIAIRCGRVKRDLHGNSSGETSWLARRIGLIPEGGQTKPTPWVSSNVLALIAREGLGISPLEVEL